MTEAVGTYHVRSELSNDATVARLRFAARSPSCRPDASEPWGPADPWVWANSGDVAQERIVYCGASPDLVSSSAHSTRTAREFGVGSRHQSLCSDAHRQAWPGTRSHRARRRGGGLELGTLVVESGLGPLRDGYLVEHQLRGPPLQPLRRASVVGRRA